MEASAFMPAMSSNRGPPAVKYTIGYDPDVRVDVVFIRVWVGNYQLHRSLIDGGAVIELAPRRTPEMLGLEIYRSQTPIPMRMANQEIHEIREYCFMQVNVAGILALCKVYLVNGSAGYDLLLSRNWMTRVRCVHDHGQDFVSIQAGSKAIVIHGETALPGNVPLLPAAQVMQDAESSDSSSVMSGSDSETLSSTLSTQAQADHSQAARESGKAVAKLLRRLRWVDEIDTPPNSAGSSDDTSELSSSSASSTEGSGKGRGLGRMQRL